MQRRYFTISHFLLGIFSTAIPSMVSHAESITEGQKQFANCIACHSITPHQNGLGPSLYGLFSRQAGTVPGFRYSNAVKNSGIIWDQKTLDKFLTDPQQVIPGNRMPFSGIENPQQRADLITYLQSVNNH